MMALPRSGQSVFHQVAGCLGGLPLFLAGAPIVPYRGVFGVPTVVSFSCREVFGVSAAVF
ncbi:hypothetical protein KQX54_000052, partial [Cotesia glomerata]